MADDSLLPEVLNARVSFWTCINPDHQAVEWSGDVATCMVCGLTSEITKRFAQDVRDHHEKHVRKTIADSLRRAAAGRLEYASRGPQDDEVYTLLTRSAAYYESTADIVEDPRNVMDVIPSWRWTDEETASLYPPKETDRG